MAIAPSGNKVKATHANNQITRNDKGELEGASLSFVNTIFTIDGKVDKGVTTISFGEILEFDPILANDYKTTLERIYECELHIQKLRELVPNVQPESVGI